ncbi:MAG: ATP-binding protein [Granulosicoccaceae bacterium]
MSVEAPPQSKVDFPNLPSALHAEVAGVDSAEPAELSLDQELEPSFNDEGGAERDAFEPESEPEEDLMQKYQRVGQAELPTVPALHMSLVQVDFKLASGQGAAANFEHAPEMLENFARFAQHTIEINGGERFQAPSGSLLWGFHDVDPVIAAQRATAASLELLSSVELFNFQESSDCHLHVGLASGQIQLEESHSPSRVLGKTVGLVAKIAALAPSQLIYLCQHSFDCLDSAHRAELVGQVLEPETESPVGVHQLVFEQPAIEDDSPARRELIGRDSELQMLRDKLQSNIANEKASWVMISGAPGIGKTRLLEEFHLDAADQRFESYYYAVANSGQAPQPCLLSMLALQVVGSRHPGLALEQIHQRLAEEMLLTEEESQLLSLMLGLQESTDGRLMRLSGQCDLLIKLVNQRRAATGLVLFVEDMHWASDAVQRRLALLCDRLVDCPALIVLSSRSSYAQEGYSFGSDMLGELCNLGGLSNTAALALAATFLPTHTPIVRQCVARASGNPLFLTQQLQAAIDTIDSHSPTSLRGIVNSKMQALQERELEQLKAAAVLGSRLTLGAWSGVLGELPDTCDELVAHQLISPDSAGYRFSHDLVHSVVYRSIDKVLQRELHMRAAEYFEHNAEVAAWHYLKAGQPMSGVAQVLQAGTRALNRGELSRAAELLDALAEVDETQLARPQRYQLHRLRGDCHTRRAAHQQALSSYEHALLVADEGMEQAQTKLLLAACWGELGNTAAAMQILGEVLAEARSIERPALETQALQLRAELLFHSGRFKEAESDLRAGLCEVHRSGDSQTIIDISQALGELLCRQGQVREAEHLLSEAHQGRERQRCGSGWADRDPWLGQCLYFMGDVCGARDILQAAVEHAKSIGDLQAQLQARCLLGPVLLDLGEPASALANGKLAMAIETDSKHEHLSSLAMVAVGESQVRLGKYALGLQMLTQAWSKAEPSDAKYSSGPWALAALATVVQRDVEQRNLLAKGEHLLHAGAEGLSKFWFYRLAIQVALGGGDERLARRYAKLLQEAESGQELPWVQQASSGLLESAAPQVLVSPLS